MSATAQIVEITAYRLAADIRHGIKPEANDTAFRWLVNAASWAKRHGHKALENKINAMCAEALGLVAV